MCAIIMKVRSFSSFLHLEGLNSIEIFKYWRYFLKISIILPISMRWYFLQFCEGICSFLKNWRKFILYNYFLWFLNSLKFRRGVSGILENFRNGISGLRNNFCWGEFSKNILIMLKIFIFDAVMIYKLKNILVRFLNKSLNYL